jgi:ferredoxin
VTEREAAPHLRAVVDRDECFGFANCVATLPSVFVLDDEGLSHARDVDADPILLEDAVEGCPRNAISIVSRPSEGDATSVADPPDVGRDG